MPVSLSHTQLPTRTSMNGNARKHICCGICSIPFKRDAELYFCICGALVGLKDRSFLNHAVGRPDRVFCELCSKTRKCPFCKFEPQKPKRLYVSYDDENQEADDEIEGLLSATYMCVRFDNLLKFLTLGFNNCRVGDVLLQTHNRLVAELDTCRELNKKLDEQSAIMNSAVEMAKHRKEGVLKSRDETANHLKKLKNLVAEKEQEVSSTLSDIFNGGLNTEQLAKLREENPE